MRRLFSAVFLTLGMAILLVTSVGVLRSLDAPAALLSTPEGARECAEGMMDALSRGDLKAAEGRIYGLQAPEEPYAPPDEAGALLWQAYLDSITCEETGRPYGTQTGLAWEITVSTMDLSSVAAAAADRAQELAREGDGEQTDALLLQAAQTALLEDREPIVRELRLELIQTDGVWYVLPEAGLLEILSGNLSE